MSEKKLIQSVEARDAYVKKVQSQEDFDVLYNEVKGNDNQYGNRMAWVLTRVCERHPEFLVKYYDEIIHWLPSTDTMGIHRSILRSMVAMKHPKTEEGRWVDYLCSVLQNPQTDVAVKVHAMQLLYNYTKVYPELGHELKLLIEEQYEKQTPAFKARARRILPRLVG